MEFFTNYNKPPRQPESYLKQTQTVYKEDFDKKTGKRKLVEIEEINIVDKIQEYAEETKISNILQKYNLNMIKQIAKDEQKIIDMTNMPENLMETLNVIDNAKYIWERQSKELKDKFNNNFKEFLAGSENGQLADILQKELRTQATKFNPEYQANISQAQKESIIAKQQEILKAQKDLETMQAQNTIINETKGENENV